MIQWLAGSNKAEEAIIARLIKLQRDSREWPRVVAEFLELIPSGTRLRCKDRRVLEAALSLCNVELHPLRNTEPAKAIPLLRATARLLNARGLYALLPKYSLQCFMQVFHQQAHADAHEAGHAPPLYAQPPIFAALLRLFLRILEPASESAEEEKAERANKLHFEANGGVDCLAALIESFGCGPRQFLHTEVASLALQLVESVLVTRAHTTDYALALHAHAMSTNQQLTRVRGAARRGAATALVAQLAAPARCRVLLHVTRHPHAEIRLRSCALLQALLLECEPRQYRTIQREACRLGALLWLLPLCFPGGTAALAAATPPPALAVSHAADDAAAHTRRRRTPSAAAASAGARLSGPHRRGFIEPVTAPAAVAAAQSATSAREIARGRWGEPTNASEFDATPPSSASTTPSASPAKASSTSAAARLAALGGGGGGGEGSARASHRGSVATLSDGGECDEYRRLVALLCDDADDALQLLGCTPVG